MKNLLKKLFAKITNKGGFSAIESLVTLGFASILTATMLPSLLPYVDHAHSLKTILEARYAFIATQHVTLLNYATTDFDNFSETGDLARVAEIANCREENIGSIEFDDYGNITKFVYDNGSFEATYTSNEGWKADKIKTTTSTAVASFNISDIIK